MSEDLKHITVDDVFESFEFLDDWEDRYRYITDLGKRLPEMEDREKTRETQGRGLRQPGLAGRPSRSGVAGPADLRGRQ